MYTIYGSRLCPDCIDAKRNFDKYNIEYKFIDILESLSSLKEFLKIRDNNESFFFKAKQKGLIGIPLIIDENNNLTYYYDKIVISKGFTPLERLSDYSSYLKEAKLECSLDNKEGC